MSSRQRRRSWLALALAALLSSGVLVVGVLIGSAGPALADSLGAITLPPGKDGGNVDDNPMFQSATSSLPCPTGFGENAGLRVGPKGNPHADPETGEPHESYENLARSLGAGGYDQAPVTIEPNRSLATALGSALVDGEYSIVIECFSLTAGRHPDDFQIDIEVCGAKWQVDACTSAKPTATTLAVEPSGSVEAGTPVTMTATVDQVAAGEVRFRRETNGQFADVGTPVAVDAARKAVLADVELPGPEGDAREVGHTLTATFTPADTAAFLGSTSQGVSVTVYRGAKPTETELTATPNSPAPSGATVKLTATTTVKGSQEVPPGTLTFRRKPAGVAGAEWTDVGTKTVTTGPVEQEMSGLADGEYDFQALFEPDDKSAYAEPAPGDLFNYRVGAAPSGPQNTTTTLTAAPSDSPQPEGTNLTLTATVAPAAAAGTVQFRDGTTQIGTPVAVESGKAEFATSALAVGTHSLTAVFMPADTNAFKTSTSNTVSFEITGDDDGDGDGDGDGGGSLASTGAPLVAIGASGLVLIGAGAGVMLLTRRRRPEPEPVAWPDDTQ